MMRGNVETSRRRYEHFVATASQANRNLPRKATAARESHWHRLPLYRTWVAPHLRGLLAIALLTLSGIVVEVLWPATSAYLIDRVVLNSQLDLDAKRQQLLLGALLLVTLTLMELGLRWIRSLKSFFHQDKLAASLRRRLLRHILRLPLPELERLQVGGLLSRLSDDLQEVASLLEIGLINPAVACLRLAVMAGLLVTLNYQIAVAVLVTLPLPFLWHMRGLRKLRPIWRSAIQDREDYNGRAGESLSGLAIVRSFAQERREELRYVVGNHTTVRKHVMAMNLQTSMSIVWELIPCCAQIGILCFGGYLVADGHVTLGVLLALQSYAPFVLQPMRQLASSMSQTQRALAALARTADLFELPRDKPDLPDSIAAPSQIESIQFDAVSFGYGSDALVIKDFDLHVPGGSVLALTGASGAGKTTLMQLLARFHDPTSGTIRINGIDSRRFKLRGFRSLIAIVPQEVFLFSGSIRENIAYGRPNATLAEVQLAAERANAHEFIQRLPLGYDSPLGERGAKLSGGQRQRIAIARAFLADPSILILDEATSNLDSESEQLIQAAMPELLAGRTTFVIAHRLSTVTRADRIIVLDQGRLIESGTHAQLMQQHGPYYQAFLHQGQEEDPTRHPPSAARQLQSLSSPA